MTLPDMIRQTVAETRTALEQSPMAQAMLDGSIDRSAYTALLRQLGRLHAALEKALASRAELADVYDAPTMARTAIINRDLKSLRSRDDGGYADATSRMVVLFRQWAEISPWMLIGTLYVFEDLRTGAMDLVRPLASALGVEVRAGVGIDYHLDGIATRPMTWQKFRATLASVSFSDAQKETICRAAAVTITGLFDLYKVVPAVPLAV